MGQGIDDFAKRMAEPPPEETPKIGRRSVLGRVALLFGGVGAGVLATDTPELRSDDHHLPTWFEEVWSEVSGHHHRS